MKIACPRLKIGQVTHVAVHNTIPTSICVCRQPYAFAYDNIDFHVRVVLEVLTMAFDLPEIIGHERRRVISD